MVQYKTIIKIIGEYVTKCPTIAEMKQMIVPKGYRERFEELKSKGYLNPLEEKDYIATMDDLDVWYSYLEDDDNDEDDIEMEQGYIDEDLEHLFVYDRRLYEGYKPIGGEIPQIDKEKYQIDNQYDDMDVLWDRATLGNMEANQIKQQNKLLDNLTTNQVICVGSYFSGEMDNMKDNIHNEDEYNYRLEGEYRKYCKGVDEVIDKTGGLLQDTVLYHGGWWDIHLKEGDTFKMKNYLSASFQKLVGEKFRSYGDDYMNFVIYAPKGTKGICGNVEEFDFYSYWYEHEYLLPRNQKFKVLNIDYDNMVAEVLLEE